METSAEKQLLLSPDNHSPKRLSIDQVICTILVMLPTVPAGMTVAFSAIALPKLNLSLIETSWFASIPTLAAIVGNLLCGFLIDRYGRKNTFVLKSVFLVVGCVLLSGAPTIMNLYTGQFFCGVSMGATVVAPTVYISESIVPDNLHTRNSLAAWNIFSVTFGISLDFLAGLFFNYQQVALLSAGLSIILTVAFLIFIPESPAWLHQRGRHQDAKLAQKRLSFAKNLSKYEAESTEDNIKPHMDLASYIKKVKRKNVYKPLLICLAYFFFQQFSGCQLYTAYLVDIITPAFLPVDPYQLAAISGCIPLIGIASYSFILPHVGLKRLCVISSTLVGIATFLVGLSLYLNQTWHSYSYAVDYVHIFAMCLDSFAGSFGLATVPYVIIGEVFPKDARGFASIPVLGVSIFYFIVLMIFPFATENLKYDIHFVFSAVSFMSIPFIYYYLPETVGRTLQEISQGFT